MPREKLTYTQKQCVRSAGKLMQQTGMLTPGARIGVAVSGGVDSFTLLKVLLIRKRIVPIPFELFILHVDPGFGGDFEPLLIFARENGVAAHLERTDHGPRAHSEENRKNSPCFYCSRLRRKRLFDLAAHYGLTHLAFGHTADDLVSTFFMNLFQAGRVDGMAMRETFFRGTLEIIRPLLWLRKRTILRAAKAWELPVWSNECPSADSSNRTNWERKFHEEWGLDKRAQQNVYNALRRVQLDIAIKRN